MNNIVRYKNRKMAVNGTYVNLEHIIDLIHGGESYMVQDYVTKKDITHKVTAAAVHKLILQHGTKGDILNIVMGFVKRRRGN